MSRGRAARCRASWPQWMPRACWSPPVSMADRDSRPGVDAFGRSVYGMRVFGLDELGLQDLDELAPATDGGGPGLIPATITRSAAAAPAEHAMDTRGGVL